MIGGTEIFTVRIRNRDTEAVYGLVLLGTAANGAVQVVFLKLLLEGAGELGTIRPLKTNREVFLVHDRPHGR